MHDRPSAKEQQLHVHVHTDIYTHACIQHAKMVRARVLYCCERTRLRARQHAYSCTDHMFCNAYNRADVLRSSCSLIIID